MLPFIIGGAIVGIGALLLDNASSSNKRARRNYNRTYDESVSTLKHSYYDAQRQDSLDKLYKVKKAKAKIAHSIYKQLQGVRDNFKSINADIKLSKDSLESLFSQKRASSSREDKRSIQETINIIQDSRKELFKIKDTLALNKKALKFKLDQANKETQNIVQEIKNIQNS